MHLFFLFQTQRHPPFGNGIILIYKNWTLCIGSCKIVKNIRHWSSRSFSFCQLSERTRSPKREKLLMRNESSRTGATYYFPQRSQGLMTSFQLLIVHTCWVYLILVSSQNCQWNLYQKKHTIIYIYIPTRTTTVTRKRIFHSKCLRIFSSFLNFVLNLNILQSNTSLSA